MATVMNALPSILSEYDFISVGVVQCLALLEVCLIGSSEDKESEMSVFQ